MEDPGLQQQAAMEAPGAAPAVEQVAAEQPVAAQAAAEAAENSLKRPADEDVGEPFAKRLHVEPAING